MKRLIGSFSLALGLIGCAATTPPSTSPEAPAVVLQGKPLSGPFASVADWCKTVNADACEERKDIVSPVMGKPMKTRSGVALETTTAAYRTGSKQVGVTFLKRGAELYLLPPIIEYDPGDKQEHLASIFSFKQYDTEDPDLVTIVHNVTHPSKASDAPASAQEMGYLADLCLVKPGPPIACVRVTREAARFWPEGKASEMPGAQALLTIRGLRIENRVIESGKPSPDITGRVLKEGNYELKFP